VAQSDRQRKILAFIEDYLDEHSYPPTIREIGNEVGISSTSVVNYHLNKLTDAGYIEREDRVSRGLKLSGPSARGMIPLMGTIQAGAPIPVMDPRTAEETEDWLDLARDLVPHKGHNVYALRVKGQSMIDALINDGDIVVMEAVSTAENGEMVAAWIKDREETTLKRFYRERDRVRLQPANPTMEPIYVAPDNVEIHGKVVAVIRSLAA
jgi:repressor LexA